MSPCVCLWTQAGLRDLPEQKGGYCIFFMSALPGCCHVAAILNLRYSHIRYMHIISSSLHTVTFFVTIVTFLVLNHLPFLTSLFIDIHAVSSIGLWRIFEMLGEIALLSALCMFFKASRKTRSHISSHSTDSLLLVFLFLPHHLSCVLVEKSYHYAVLPKL